MESLVGHPKGETLFSLLSGKVKIVNTTLQNSPVVGLKKRLNQYDNFINSEQGVGKALFDDKLLVCLKKYCMNYSTIKSELGYLNSLVDSDGHKFSRNLKQVRKLAAALQEFGRDDYTSFRWNKHYQESLKDLFNLFGSNRFKPVKYVSDDHIRSLLPKTDTHSGLTYLETGMKKKGDNVEGALARLEVIAVDAVKVGTHNRVNLISYRTQASGEYTDDGERTNTCKHKTRLVSMIDFYVILNEMRYSIPFQKFMSGMNFYAGGKNDNVISNIIANMRTKYRNYYSIDYSAFDQSISSWLIRDCFNILRRLLVMDKFESDLFTVVENDFIRKRFLISSNHEVVSTRGIPSGSMFTQIIGSMCNYVMVRTFMRSVNVKNEMVVMGDDNLIYSDRSGLMNELGSYLNKNFGVKVNVDKSTVGGTDDPEFLSRYWGPVGPYKHENLLISKMLFPERFRSYNKLVTPDLVLYCYYLLSKRTMMNVINMEKFFNDHPSIQQEANSVDSRYIPGALSYIREYT